MNASRRDRKNTQRERLLRGMIDVAGRRGYAETTIAHIITHAGVSRPTFYDYFSDKEVCFIAALGEAERAPLAKLRQLVRAVEPHHALEAVIRAMVEMAESEPATARLLMSEPMSAGPPRALEARDRRISKVARLIDDAHRQVSAETPIPDYSSELLVGGVERLLGSRLARGESVASLLDDVLRWVASYRRPAGDRRWWTLQPAPAPPPSPFLSQAPLAPPPALPPGRPRFSTEQVAENHRLRFLLAAAQLAMENGCSATTVGEIVESAGLSVRAFRALFADKQDVFAAVHELTFQRVVAATASAFFAGETWPERVWEAGRAFVQSIEQDPSLAYVTFVEFYAAGPTAAQRNNERLLAFALFLQEGYQHKPTSARPSQLVFEAIAATNFELIYRQIRASPAAPSLSGLIPHATFVDLAPFLGPTEANRFIDGKLAGSS